jgi:SulP family sulfate permease
MVGEHAGAVGRWAGLRADLSRRRLPGTLAIGLVQAIVNGLLTVALMTLVFQGSLEDALPIGIGVGLAGSAVIGVVVAFGSSFPGTYAGIQDASAAILGLSAASIASQLAGQAATETVLAMLAVTSLATGLVFMALGYFGLGDIARFMPFPVIGGLLAGTGYLIVAGGIGLLGIETIGDVTGPGALGMFWPALLLATLFFVASRRHWPSWTYLASLTGGIIGFHVVTRVAGVDRDAAMARGWLVGPFPDGGLWPGPVTDVLAGADWGAIGGEAATLAAILLIVPISLLLYIGAVEVETKTDLDMNAELRSTGWANLASAAVGSAPGYLYLADTLITHRLVGRRRGAAVVGALFILGLLLAGAFLLEFLPQFIVGGLLLFVGVDFMEQWLWASRRRMTALDYTLMWAIVLIIATVGFLPGVGVGLLAAIVLFVVRYSRIDVVKHSLTAREHQSNIERSSRDAEYLQAAGDEVLILELQGFIFFGTASRIIRHIHSHLERAGAVRFVVIDFRRVTGVDSSAVMLLERVVLLARDHGAELVFTGMSPSQRSQFSELIGECSDVLRDEPDLDHGMAWCEDRILAESGPRPGEARALPEGLAIRLTPYLSARAVPAGTRLMQQGDPTPGMYLIRSGRVTVLLEGPDGQQVRLRTLLDGTVLGEISLYRNEPCTATAVTDTECDLLHLTPESFDDLCRRDPAAAADLHAFVARTLAGRVSHANRAIRALQG